MKAFFIVLKKELLDCFRDRRSLIMMLLPLFIFPLLFSFYNQQLGAADESLAKQITIATEGENAIRDIAALLQTNDTEVKILTAEDAATALKTGKVAIILNKDENGYHLIYDQNSVKSTKALSMVAAAIEMQKTAQIYAIFNLYGESTNILDEYNYSMEDISAHEENGTNALIAALGPMLIIMFIASGGSSVALDLFCGEKERGSLESLLATQTGRRPLYLAKLVTVLLFVLISALISVSGYLISFSLNQDLTDSFGGGGIGLSTNQMFLFLLTSLVFAFFTAAVISALSLSAKTVKEGSLRISLFTLIPTVIGGASMYMEANSISNVTCLIPFINMIHILKTIFINAVDLTHLWITVGSNAAYALLFVMIGYRFINSERVLNK